MFDRCAIAKEIAKDIERQKCSTDSKECEIATEIENAIISRECLSRFSCEDFLNETITIYRATDELRDDLERGYIGGEHKTYWSLHPEGLIEMIKDGQKFREGKLIELEVQDIGLLKVDNVPIDWLYVDPETWYDIHTEIPRILGFSKEGRNAFEWIIQSYREKREFMPLKELYPLCKDIGSEQIIKEELGWLILPRGKRIYISEENIITP